MNVEQGMQLSDLKGMVRRRKSLAITIAGVVFLASIVVAAVLPDQYESYTTLLIEPQTISSDLIEAQVGQTDLNQRLHIMTMQILSRPRLSRIIDELELYEGESEQMTRAEVIALMRSAIRVEPVLPELADAPLSRTPTQINTFRLYFRSDRAKTAAAVANRLANDYIEEHIRERVQVSGDTSEFIESELQRQTSRIEEVEGRIAQVKAENPGRLPEDFTANQRMLERTIDALRDAQRELSDARSDVAFYTQQKAVSTDLERPNDDSNPMRRLQMLELQLAEMRSRGWTEKHPDVQATKMEIENVRRGIQEHAAQAQADEANAEPVMSVPAQVAEANRSRAELRANALEQEIVAYRQRIDEINQRLADTPRVAERLIALQREYDHLSENVRQFKDKQLTAGVAADMERRQKGEQFRVLESAVPPPDPTSPNRILILAMGLVLGMALGGGTGLLVEATDSSFHGPRELQTAFRLPVLAAIPGIFLESDRVAQRRRRAVIGLVATAIVGIVLMGAVFGYVVVNGSPSWLQDKPAEGAEGDTAWWLGAESQGA